MDHTPLYMDYIYIYKMDYMDYILIINGLINDYKP